MPLHQALLKGGNSASVTTEKKALYTESTRRSLAKTVSWRAIGTIDTIFISWLITGTLQLAFSIGAIELISKMILYFFHERTWNNIPYGK